LVHTSFFSSGVISPGWLCLPVLKRSYDLVTGILLEKISFSLSLDIQKVSIKRDILILA